MNTQDLIFILIYIAMAIVTYRICSPEHKEVNVFDAILIPIICALWPLAWGAVLLGEIVGAINRMGKQTKK